MKHQAINLLKFKLLSRRLKTPLWQTVGILEALWLFAQLNARDGDLSAFDAEGIAAWLEWGGDGAELLDALVETKWLDRNDDRLVVHHWDHHKPNWIKATAASPRTKKRSISLSESLSDAQSETLSESLSDTHSKTLSVPLSATPPIPEPIPEPKPKTKRGKTPLPPVVELPDAIRTEALTSAAAEWIAYRAERRKPLTATSLAKLSAQIADAVAANGEAAVLAMFDRAIANGWTGWNFPAPSSSPRSGRSTVGFNTGPSHVYHPGTPTRDEI